MSVPEKGNMDSGSKKKSSYSKALKKIAGYCAYQERAISEVVSKLDEMELEMGDREKILQTLQDQDFINEKRFVESFVKGRFNLKRWGRIRIRQELKMRGIPNQLIQKGLELLAPEEYQDTLLHLAERKWKLTNEENLYKRKTKVVRFLVFRGFEPDLVWEVVEAISTNDSL
ncbi:regulatory protein RecX [uncultured Cyclobacterium sp.]|uniref:regulatory protein RecX n=1 Tax=uncultured Cyclobacterium sp. TaxID=453820 RepID=UPI0030EC4019